MDSGETRSFLGHALRNLVLELADPVETGVWPAFSDLLQVERLSWAQRNLPLKTGKTHR